MFVSSKTIEFANERKIIKEGLEKLSKCIHVFIFEDDAPTSSKKSEEVYKEELLGSQIYIGLFRNEYSKATIEEYNLALSNSKERLIYVDDSKEELRDNRLRDEINKFHGSNTVKHIKQYRDIQQVIINDVIYQLVKREDSVTKTCRMHDPD